MYEFVELKWEIHWGHNMANAIAQGEFVHEGIVSLVNELQ